MAMIRGVDLGDLMEAIDEIGFLLSCFEYLS